MSKVSSSTNYAWQLLADHNLAVNREKQDLSEEAALVVVESAKKLQLPKARMVSLEATVKGAVANLIRRRGPDQPYLPLALRVYATEEGVNSKSRSANSRSGALALDAPGKTPSAACSWGFFLVEKMDMVGLDRSIAKFNDPELLPETPGHAIEVYLYQEGESGG